MPAIASRLAGLPRRTIRLRLTVLYGLVLTSGAIVLMTAYLTVARSTVISQNNTGTGGGPVKITAPQPAVPGATPGHQPGPQTAQQAAGLHRLLVESCAALLALTAFSVLAGWWMAGRALRPVREMTDAARRLSEANLHERLAVSGPDDELKELGETFDSLLARLEAAFEAQKRFVANASHELRTPLTFQRAMIEVALADRRADAAALRHVCERVLAVGAEQERLIEALLTLARSQRGLDRREPVDLAALAGRIVAQRSTAGGGEPAVPPVHVDSALGPAQTAGDRRLLERLVANLLDNALHHNTPGGWVTVRTETDRDLATLHVANSGPVIPPDQAEVLLQPFQRLAPPSRRRDGLGLGLSIVAAIAAAHGANLATEPRAGGGLDITVSFPALRPA
jgi:signal transduction histidine kinase